MNQLERRAFSAELRVSGGGDTEPTRIVGHAAVFNSWSENLGGFREKIEPGTFAETIEADDIRALFNHSPDMVLGRNKAGTLRLSEDDSGLLTEIDPPDTQLARDLVTSIERGDINQMSFAFRVNPGGDDWSEDADLIERTLTSVSLLDVSPVTFPAYTSTDVSVRALEEYKRGRDGRCETAQRLAEARRRYLHLLKIRA